MIRLALPSPRNSDCIRLRNGRLEKSFIDWRFSLPYETMRQLGDYDVNSLGRLVDVLRVVGSHSVLWIDSCKGTIAPMDSPPQGWTYPNGQDAEVQFFWHWYPDLLSSKALAKEANSFADQGFESIFADQRSGIFKSLVPFRLTDDLGEITDVESIPITRLAGMTKSSCQWFFETDKLQLNIQPRDRQERKG